MHEMSIAESILQIVEDAAAKQGFKRVTEVRLEIGVLSGVEPDALGFCLDVVLKDSVAEGARIEMELLPGQGYCIDCSATVPINALYDACIECGSYKVEATSGKEMRVKDLLVE
jgi:hydrogenase nickel incorporation protein HypA/HybF